MERSNKRAWLAGPGDLKEAEVDDVPSPGKSVKVRGLPAAYSLDAVTDATETRVDGRGNTTVAVNRSRLEILQFTHGVIDPEFTEEEARQIAEKFGPAWRKVVDKIDELSALDKEAIDEANRRFPGSPGDPSGEDLGDGAGAGNGGPDVPARAGAGAGDAGG